MYYFKQIFLTLRELFVRLIGGNFRYPLHFNTPIKYSKGKWYRNERLLEHAYILNRFDLEEHNKRVLDFGCGQSYLPLQIASLGYNVTGIDLRDYAFTHPKFSFHRINLLDFQDYTGFDYIISVSVLEHIGLSVYGEDDTNTELEQIINKFETLINPGGELLLTVPIGIPHEDNFLRSFSESSFTGLFENTSFQFTDKKYYQRKEFKHWSPCTAEEIQHVSNKKSDRGQSGVNGVGCFALSKDA